MRQKITLSSGQTVLLDGLGRFGRRLRIDRREGVLVFAIGRSVG
jgi:hypothetical protein